MTINIIIMAVLYLLMMGCIFFMGYATAMRSVIQKVQIQILEKTRNMMTTAKTPTEEAIIDGRLQVTSELTEVLRPPFYKFKDEK